MAFVYDGIEVDFEKEKSLEGSEFVEIHTIHVRLNKKYYEYSKVRN